MGPHPKNPYYSGLRGDGERVSENLRPWQRRGMYSNGAIGVATLRRDGFAGMVAYLRRNREDDGKWLKSDARWYILA